MNIKERRLGVEIECQIKVHPEDAVRLLQNAGISAVVDGDTNSQRNVWKFTHDGSVSGRSWDRRNGYDDDDGHDDEETGSCDEETAFEESDITCADTFYHNCINARAYDNNRYFEVHMSEAPIPYVAQCDGDCSNCQHTERTNIPYEDCGYHTEDGGCSAPYGHRCRFRDEYDRPEPPPENRVPGFNFQVYNDGFGVEIVSPPLTLAQFEAQLTTVLNTLGKYMTVNRSCGLHVHIESGDFTPKALKHLVQIMAAGMEGRIYFMAGGKRASSSYCLPMDTDMVRIATCAASDLNWERLSWGYYGQSDRYRNVSKYNSKRYMGTNLNSHWYRGTVEFRYFQATVLKERLLTYVRLCMLTVQKAFDCRYVTPTLRRLLAANVGMDGNTEENFKALFKHMMKPEYIEGLGVSPDQMARTCESMIRRRQRTETQYDKLERVHAAQQSFTAAPLQDLHMVLGREIWSSADLTPEENIRMVYRTEGARMFGRNGVYQSAQAAGALCNCAKCLARRHDDMHKVSHVDAQRLLGISSRTSTTTNTDYTWR